MHTSKTSRLSSLKINSTLFWHVPTPELSDYRFHLKLKVMAAKDSDSNEGFWTIFQSLSGTPSARCGVLVIFQWRFCRSFILFDSGSLGDVCSGVLTRSRTTRGLQGAHLHRWWCSISKLQVQAPETLKNKKNSIFWAPGSMFHCISERSIHIWLFIKRNLPFWVLDSSVKCFIMGAEARV